jgi:hypothetical protein
MNSIPPFSEQNLYPDEVDTYLFSASKSVLFPATIKGKESDYKTSPFEIKDVFHWIIFSKVYGLVMS